MSSNKSTNNFTLVVKAGVINPTLVEFLMTFNILICAEVIGIVGIVANFINIWNFKKQGLHDSVNISLTALAVSDIGALFFQLVVNVLFNPLWRRVQLPFYSSTVLAMVFFYPHGYFIRVSGFITAFAAFERCLCVVLPMDVKRIMTRNVAIVVNFLIFVVLLLYLYPEHSVVYYDWLFIPTQNRSVITFFFREDFEYVMTFTNIINDLFIPYITYVSLIICTMIIVVQLKSKAKWRQSVTGKVISSGLSKTELSIKDKKAVIMLTVVSVIYVTCLTPECVLMTVIGFIQDMKVEGPLWDLFLTIYSFSSLLETINCSVSILVYYNMSTKYRETLHMWFPKLGHKF
ncbi:FMRFamide receptor [Biomphalaria glabrata]|nr:FMRFamide receptor-like [Biomphalaria glabrata]